VIVPTAARIFSLAVAQSDLHSPAQCFAVTLADSLPSKALSLQATNKYENRVVTFGLCNRVAVTITLAVTPWIVAALCEVFTIPLFGEDVWTSSMITTGLRVCAAIYSNEHSSSLSSTKDCGNKSSSSMTTALWTT
jgi:hypothetical protein